MRPEYTQGLFIQRNYANAIHKEIFDDIRKCNRNKTMWWNNLEMCLLNTAFLYEKMRIRPSDLHLTAWKAQKNVDFWKTDKGNTIKKIINHVSVVFYWYHLLFHSSVFRNILKGNFNIYNSSYINTLIKILRRYTKKSSEEQSKN